MTTPQDNKLTEDQRALLQADIENAKKMLEGLVSYERAGIDVSGQRKRLEDVITRNQKLLENF